MRHVLAMVVIFSGRVCTLAGDRPVTVIVDFDSAHPVAVTRAMQQETSRLLAALGYSPDWRPRASITESESFDRVAMVHFHGTCSSLEIAGSRVPARMPVGSTAVQNGDVLPFAEIDCSTIGAYISREIVRRDPATRQQIYGRALGRVVAHELEHILSNTKVHESAGIFRESFSASDLAGAATFESVR